MSILIQLDFSMWDKSVIYSASIVSSNCYNTIIMLQDWAIQYWIDGDAPAAKINLGISAVSIGYKLLSGDHHVPGSEQVGPSLDSYGRYSVPEVRCNSLPSGVHNSLITETETQYLFCIVYIEQSMLLKQGAWKLMVPHPCQNYKSALKQLFLAKQVNSQMYVIHRTILYYPWTVCWHFEC